MRHRYPTLALLVLAVTATVPASAQPPQPDSAATPADIATARELFRDAAALAQKGKWEEALDRYSRSMALRPSPLTRYSIAVAQSHTGRLVEATESIRTFFREATPDMQPYVQPAEDLLRSLEPRIARLTIRIPGDPRGAKVLLDGREIPAATINVERLVNPGKHKVEASVPGHAVFFEQVELPDGASKVVLVRLQAEGADGLGPQSSLGAGSETGSSDGSKTTGIVLVAAGGAVFLAGGVLGALAMSKAKDSPTRDGADADSAKTLALAGDVSMGAGLVAVGIGTYLWLAAPSAPAPSRSGMAVIPWAGKRAAGVGVSGAF